MRAKKVFESIHDILKPKPTKEISAELDLLVSMDQLIDGKTYVIYDPGMDNWMRDLQLHIRTHRGKRGEETVYVFKDPYPWGNFEMELTADEMLETINDNEIAFD